MFVQNQMIPNTIICLDYREYKEVNNMAVHHGGKVGAAAKALASKSSSKSTKSNAAKTLVNHKNTKH